MIKKNLKPLILSSVIILLPIAAGLLLWDQLPDTLPIHWGADGNVDNWGSKLFAVVFPPLFFLATHWLCVLVTSADPGNKNRNRKAQKMVLWTVPFVSVFSSAMLYGTALGFEWNMASITFAVIGIMFIVIGNYLPKTTQNYTIGIKVPWALHNEENWNATHRFGGKVWVIGGLAMMLMTFFPGEKSMVLMVIVLLIMGFVPMLYSWLYYKKQCKAGMDPDLPETSMDKTSRTVLKGTLIFLVILFSVIGFLLFSGNIEYTFTENSLSVEPSFWNGISVDYADVTQIELRRENIGGERIWGYGSFRLLLGTFENEEFGHHTRYTYYDPEACIIVTCGEKLLVLSGEDAESTEALYETLSQKLEG